MSLNDVRFKLESTLGLLKKILDEKKKSTVLDAHISEMITTAYPSDNEIIKEDMLPRIEKVLPLLLSLYVYIDEKDIKAKIRMLLCAVQEDFEKKSQFFVKLLLSQDEGYFSYNVVNNTIEYINVYCYEEAASHLLHNIFSLVMDLSHSEMCTIFLNIAQESLYIYSSTEDQANYPLNVREFMRFQVTNMVLEPLAEKKNSIINLDNLGETIAMIVSSSLHDCSKIATKYPMKDSWLDAVSKTLLFVAQIMNSVELIKFLLKEQHLDLNEILEDFFDLLKLHGTKAGIRNVKNKITYLLDGIRKIFDSVNC